MPFLYCPLFILSFFYVSVFFVPTSYAQQENVPQEYEYLYLDAFLERTSLNNSIECLTVDFNTFYYSFDEISSLFGLAMQVNDANLQIDGWFINENNKVTIDLNNLSYIIGKKSGKIQANELLIIDELLYINSETFNLWFGIKSEFKINDLKVNFISEQILPLQAKLLRDKKHKLHQMSQGKKQKAHQISDTYQWLGTPNIDINAQLNTFRRNDQQSNSQRLTINGSGDFAKHGSEF